MQRVTQKINKCKGSQFLMLLSLPKYFYLELSVGRMCSLQGKLVLNRFWGRVFLEWISPQAKVKFCITFTPGNLSGLKFIHQVSAFFSNVLWKFGFQQYFAEEFSDNLVTNQVAQLRNLRALPAPFKASKSNSISDQEC